MISRLHDARIDGLTPCERDCSKEMRELRAKLGELAIELELRRKASPARASLEATLATRSIVSETSRRRYITKRISDMPGYFKFDLTRLAVSSMADRLYALTVVETVVRERYGQLAPGTVRGVALYSDSTR